MTFHCFLLICNSHSQSLLILRKALKEKGSSGSPWLLSLSPRGKNRVNLKCTEGWWIRQGAWEDGLTDRRGNWGHLHTTGLWQLPLGTALQLWSCSSPRKYLMCQTRSGHGCLLQAYIPFDFFSMGHSTLPFGEIDEGSFKRKNWAGLVRGGEDQDGRYRYMKDCLSWGQGGIKFWAK